MHALIIASVANRANPAPSMRFPVGHVGHDIDFAAFFTLPDTLNPCRACRAGELPTGCACPTLPDMRIQDVGQCNQLI
jgi:hypothetical protein